MRKIFCIIFGASSALASAAHVDGVYNYSSHGIEAEKWGDPLFIMIGEKPSKMEPFVASGSEVQSAEFCSFENSNICVASERLTFSVPKHRVSVGEEWTFKGVKFSVSGETGVSVLGRKLRGYRILALAANHLRWVFTYSYEIGLVFIEEHSESNTSPITYILENETGFGTSQEH